MKLRMFGSPPGDRRWIPVVFFLLFLVGVGCYRHPPGDDLAASYIGCRLIAAHKTADLYSYDPAIFSEVNPDDDAWHAQAQQSQFTGGLHPYVQTPLWAWSLQPLCANLRFPPFRSIFMVLNLASFLGIVWLVARFWTPSLLNPIAMAVVLSALYRSEPFRYSMVLMQTHVLYIFLTISSLLLAQRRRALPEALAGILLALAAAVKITPGFLIIYWLLTRRYRAALSATLASAVLLAAAVLITGPSLFSTYLADLHRITGTLLVSENNQSFAAFLMGRYHPNDQLDELNSYVLPTTLRLGSNLLVLASVLVGGLIDRRSAANPPSSVDNTSPPPFGAMVAMVGSTLFTPIAWTHYYIVLLPPIMLLLHQFHTASQSDEAVQAPARRPWWILATVAVIAALNMRPIAPDVLTTSFGPLSLVRSTFYSGVLCLLALAIAVWQRRFAFTVIHGTPKATLPDPRGATLSADPRKRFAFRQLIAPPRSRRLPL